MPFFKRLGAALVSRRALACVAVLLLAAAIWFFGPWLGFGAMRPLASIGARVTAIVMLVAVCLAAWAGFVLARRARPDRSAPPPSPDPAGMPDQPVAQAEIAEVELALQRALRQLKHMRGAGGLGRLFDGKRHLYALPWYLVVGAPGTGKTSALLNAGLPFPIAAQMRAAAGPYRATPHTDWWFTNDAVLIDTAGRYASQASNPAVDTAEWQGLVALLRKHRTRAPINGVLLTLSCADLLTLTPAKRVQHAAALRARLADLRRDLRIRFPVYVLVTKLDQLAGFAEYFQSLPGDRRAQPWGFTLALDDGRKPRGRRGPHGRDSLPADLLAQCRSEMARVDARLQAGLNTRLQEEFDEARRRRLVTLRPEFGSLTEPLLDMLDHVFQDSRFDDTEPHPMLRGVYFSSAMQTGEVVVGDHGSVFQRLARGEGGFHRVPAQAGLGEGDDERIAEKGAGQDTGNRSYFLRDVFERIIVPEAHLVKPNLRWEHRFRLLRWLGHALALGLFLWLAAALCTSLARNLGYLDRTTAKAGALAAGVAALRQQPQPAAIPGLLAAAQALPADAALDPANPPTGWRYGLYSVPPIQAASARTYARLQDSLLAPYLAQRVQHALVDAVEARDIAQLYDTLRIYLMLYDHDRFNGPDVRDWVHANWAARDGAQPFGGQTAVLAQLDERLGAGRAIASPYPRDEMLIQAARVLLDGNTSVEGLYARAKAAMRHAAPPEFTLGSAVGAQAVTVFARASGEPIERGVPGLFTHDGYHEVFRARLPAFVDTAQAMDTWVMGRAPSTGKGHATATLTREIRRLYLEEYARHWDAFLADIRPVAGQNLAFDLETLRTLAAPDSPLSRLGRAAMRETTLVVPREPDDASSADQALASLKQQGGKAARVAKAANVAKAGAQAMGDMGAETRGPETRSEPDDERRDLTDIVDSRFAALREVVSGQSGAVPVDGAVASGKPGLDAVVGMVGTFYTSQMVASHALATRTLPPPSDAAMQLRMAATRLPAPFRAVLDDLAVAGTRGVNRGMGDLLVVQMEAMIGETCRRSIDGKYPFAPAALQEVDPDDFARVFAAGGVLDDFFQKVLAPHVDTTITPWRYKLASPDIPPVAGPSLAPFQQAKAIREAFFREPGARTMAWKVELRVVDLDPAITELGMDFDGQTQRYVHGPVIPLKVTWPGPRGGQRAEISASPRIRPDTSTLAASGPWALMRVIAQGRLAGSATASHFTAEYDFDGRTATLDVHTGSVANPWTTGLLRDFACPRRSG